MDPIPYDKSGVYQTINSPSKTNINVQSLTHCYTQARAFHQVYCNIHKTFNEEPEKVSEAVELMESLQWVHAKPFCLQKILIQTTNASGPVWD